jgi:hypothetical protein
MTEQLVGRLMARRGIGSLAVLSNRKVVVTLDAERPILLSIASQASGELFLGDPEGHEPAFTVWSDKIGKYLSSREGTLRPSYRATRAAERISYRVELRDGGRVASELDLAFELAGEDLFVSFGNCVEHAGYLFMNVDANRVVSAHSVQPHSRMLIGSNAGRLVDPSRCRDGEHEHRYNWMREAWGMLGLVYGPRFTVVLQLDSLDDTLLSRVGQNEDGRFASLGAKLRHRYASSIPAAQFSPHGQSRFRLHLIEADTGSPEKGWVVGARWLQGLAPGQPSELYKNAFIYKIFLGCPGALKQTSFEQCLELIRRIGASTDGARQIPYLVGFQHDGHDSRYPDVFTVNPHAGGMERLLHLMREAEKLNANVSFHDNYDDAYLDSPSWDAEDIAMNPDGELLKGGVWNGVQAYWNGMPHYARTKAPARIKRTLEMYPIRETYHLDVLTASVFRLDFRTSHPSDRDDDWEARRAIVEEFRKHGIDVTSEGCGWPFLEFIRHSWSLPHPREEVFAGDKRVPFGPFLAHGHVTYGGSRPDDSWLLDGLLYGALYSQDLTASTPEKEILDAFFLLQVPLNGLRDELMTDYEEDGTRKRISYSAGSSVEVDFESFSHEVCVRGVRVLKDYVSFAPGTREGTYLYYRSRDGREQPWQLPPQWRGARRLEAVALTPSGEGEHKAIETRDGIVTFGLPEAAPYRITRGE